MRSGSAAAQAAGESQQTATRMLGESQYTIEEEHSRMNLKRCLCYMLDFPAEESFMDLFGGVKKLMLKERAAHAREIAKLDAALEAQSGGRRGHAKRTLSGAARKRISDAQKKRWAKARRS